MPGAVKGADLRRDPRVAFHSQSEDADESDPESWPGDAKFSGRACWSPTRRSSGFWAAYGGAEPPGGPDASDLFRIDVEDVVLVTIELPNMVIESWHERGGYRRRART
jgi:Vacuolar H+-ATPase V1 sector, subunit H